MLKVKDERCLQQLPVCVCVNVPSLFHFSPCSLIIPSLTHTPICTGCPRFFLFKGRLDQNVSICVCQQQLITYVCLYAHVCVCVCIQATVITGLPSQLLLCWGLNIYSTVSHSYSYLDLPVKVPNHRAICPTTQRQMHTMQSSSRAATALPQRCWYHGMLTFYNNNTHTRALVSRVGSVDVSYVCVCARLR